MKTELTVKNRDRSPYTFANINLLGKCNCDCYFCIGKDLKEEFDKYNNLKQHFSEWSNWEIFLTHCKDLSIPQIYVTGQNTDSLCYPHLEEMMHYLKGEGFFVGLRTNGLLARKKMKIINLSTTCWGDAVSYSVHTLNVGTMYAMTGVDYPEYYFKWEDYWREVFQKTTAKMRVAIVCTRYNVQEIYDLIKFLAQFPNIEYIQVRKVSTDTRIDELGADLDCFEMLVEALNGDNEKRRALNIPLDVQFTFKEFEKSKVYNICGKNVSLWRTVGTTVNSINYFTNGKISNCYFIIEGYAKEAGIQL